MNRNKFVNLPYFDYLFESIQEQDQEIENSFGRHVHWGYWNDPKQAALTGEDFASAADQLSAEICASAKVRNQQCLLDVGCGFGGTIGWINGHYQDMHLYGLNLDDRQLLRARQTVTAAESNKIQFQQGDACRLPFPDQSIDVLLAVECIFHFPDRAEFFSEAQRVLKPGGFLALSDFVPVKPMLPLFKLEMPASWGVGFYGRCNVDCTVSGYHRLAEQSGLTVAVERDITVNTLPTYSYLRKLGSRTGPGNSAAAVETLTIEVFSRLKLLKYYIFSFQKPLN